MVQQNSTQARAGLLSFKVNGEGFDVAAAGIEYCLGTAKREAVMSATGSVGFKETPQVPYITCKVIDRKGLDARALFSIEDATITAELSNGKTLLGTPGWYAGDATGSSDTGELDVRFEFLRLEEV